MKEVAPIVVVREVDLAVDPAPLVLDEARRAAVDAHWRGAVASNPAMWNGDFFLFEDVRLTDGRLAARARATDFATFLHWRAEAPAQPGFHHIFPVAAVTSADDRLLLGVMSSKTANPGRVYPPSGSFDRGDLVGDRLDPLANIVRELREEVGLDAGDLVADPHYLVMPSGPARLAVIRRHRSPLSADRLEALIAAHLAVDTEEELAGVRFVPFDVDLAGIPIVPYVSTLLAHLAGRPAGDDAPTAPIGAAS